MLFLICNIIPLEQTLGPPRPLSLACGNASSYWSQPWGPLALRTSYHATRQTIALALLDLLSLPFPFASLFLVSNSSKSTNLLWVPSVNTLYPTQLLTNSMNAKPSCPFCLETDEAPLSSTRACVSCNAPMYSWCGCCSHSKQEPRGGCCSRVCAIFA